MKSLKFFYALILFTMLAWIPTSKANSPHSYHVSYTEINTTDSSITIALEVFTDDLELAVKQLINPKKYFLGGDSISTDELKYTKAYMEQVFQIVVNGKALTNSLFFDVSTNPDRTTLYLELENKSPISSLAIKNTILISLFEDQENIIESKHNGVVKKALLHKGKEVTTFTY